MKNILFILLISVLLTTNALAQNAADEFYDPAEMEKARKALKHGTGKQINYLVLIDRIEFQDVGKGAGVWDVQSWIGGDINRLWIKSEGEYSFDEDSFEEGNVEVLYGKAISPFFDFQAGFGQNFEAGPSSSYGTIGIQGLAPYWFEVDASFKINSEGDITANFEAEYELLLTQRLILQPRFEAQISFQDMPKYDQGSGVTNIGVGVRLRYEFIRKFAPYVGVSWNRKLGETATLARLDGEGVDNKSLVIGIRAWF